MTEMNESINFSVVHATRAATVIACFTLPAGCTVTDALAVARTSKRFPVIDTAGDTLIVAIFGKRVPPSALLKNGDRVELLHPLRYDPKESRRRRAAGKQHRTPQRHGP